MGLGLIAVDLIRCCGKVPQEKLLDGQLHHDDCMASFELAYSWLPFFLENWLSNAGLRFRLPSNYQWLSG